MGDTRSAAESSLKQLREELRQEHRKLNGEFQAELRALRKQGESQLAALDEQLWLTDQRIGQRIDDLCRTVAQADHGSRSVIDNRAEHGSRSMLDSPAAEQRSITNGLGAGREAALSWNST